MSPDLGAPVPESAHPDAASVNSDYAVTPVENNLSLTSIGDGITNIAEEVAAATPPGISRRGPGRPPRQSVAPVTWSIRGVSRETRNVLEQAASQAGKTLGQYLNENVRHQAEQELHQAAPPPAPAPSLQEEIHYLRQLVENLTAMIAASATSPTRHSEDSPRL